MEADWVDLLKEDRSIRLDIRYGTELNFLNRKFYPTKDAFLHRPVAESVLNVHRELSASGYGLLIFDAYRPLHVTKAFWELATVEQRDYLADPEKGSHHNRGCAVDLSLYSLSNGLAVEMPSDFDEMNEKAWISYKDGPGESLRLRDLLIQTMEKHSFTVARNEWWHFNHPLRTELPIYDLSFQEIRNLIG